MVKQTLFLAVLVAALIPVLAQPTAAQEGPLPAISDYFKVPPSPPVLTKVFPRPKVSYPPSYCKPCLFYAGDFDPSAANPNGLWNGASAEAQGEVLVPFTVPRGRRWLVTGLFTNNISTTSALDPPQATWSISANVTDGSGGRTIASGTAAASYMPTGRSGFGMAEYTSLVKIKPLWLYPGTYWMTVVPQCTSCNVPFYLTDVEDYPGLNAYGPPEPTDLSYFNSGSFGFSYAPANSSGCSDVGCDAFSVGVLGFAL